MNLKQLKTCAGAALAALTLGAATSQAGTLIGSYTNDFNLGGNTADFSGSGSVASWIYWYNTPGGNTAMYCHYGLDANGQTNTSGCLEVDSPFGTAGTQNVFFGTFDNQWGYDFNTEANLVNYSNITFSVMVPKGTQPDANGNFGNIGVGIINANYGYQQFGNPVIPGAASNGWVNISVLIDKTQGNLSNVPGIAFDFNNYGGYPQFPFTNYIDNLQLNISPVPVPPPTITAKLPVAVPGANFFAAQAGQPYNRYDIATVANTGLGFLDQPSVTYSWNIQSFPKANPDTFQQQFFIADGIPGPYDQAIDWNFANIIIITIQQAANGQGNFDFRFKTNEPAGNGMVYNTTSPTDSVNNPNGWPVEPYATLNSPSPVGTWSVTFANNGTSVTVTGPGGVSTNFTWDAASAALFADPVTLLVGGQPNDASGFGQAVVLGSFAAVGNDAPFSDEFTNDTELDSNVWYNFSNNNNVGNEFVPPGLSYWLSWSVPDSGFSAQTAPTVNSKAAGWTDLPLTTFINNGVSQGLLPASWLVGTNQGYFRLVKRIATQLQVLLPGETNAPNTLTGKGGTPDVQSNGGLFTVTVNSVDSTFHIVSTADNISITSNTDPTAGTVTGTLSGGTAQITYGFDASGVQTVTASDTDNTNILSNTSSPVTVQ